MCGIVGVHFLSEKASTSQEMLGRMTGMLCHRGPDRCGMYLDRRVGLADLLSPIRLSIIGKENRGLD
jgi:asparagine synthetase B (glutamine-hydrolysing)